MFIACSLLPLGVISPTNSTRLRPAPDISSHYPDSVGTGSGTSSLWDLVPVGKLVPSVVPLLTYPIFALWELGLALCISLEPGLAPNVTLGELV